MHLYHAKVFHTNCHCIQSNEPRATIFTYKVAHDIQFELYQQMNLMFFIYGGQLFFKTVYYDNFLQGAYYFDDQFFTTKCVTFLFLSGSLQFSCKGILLIIMIYQDAIQCSTLEYLLSRYLYRLVIIYNYIAITSLINSTLPIRTMFTGRMTSFSTSQ